MGKKNVVRALALAMAGALLFGAAGCADEVKGDLPVVSSAGFGSIPDIKFPRVDPPTAPVKEVLNPGDGKQKVTANDLVMIDYYGRVWDGEALPDSTMTDGSGPASVLLSKPPIEGWRQLAGAHVGDRVMLVVPPKWAYGETGNEYYGIPSNATLVYVVDIRYALDPNTVKDVAAGDPLPVTLPSGVSITEIGQSTPPKVTVSATALRPATNTTFYLTKGSGDVVQPHYKVAIRTIEYNWDGSILSDGWSTNELSSVGAEDIDAVNHAIGSQLVRIAPGSSESDPVIRVSQIMAAFPSTR